MKFSKYAVLLCVIMAFVLTISGILFALFGLFYEKYANAYLSTYFLITGTVLGCIGILFIAGIISLRRHPVRAIRLLGVGTIIFMLSGIIPVWRLFRTLTDTSTLLYFLVFAIVLYVPFVWLFFYLWKFSKSINKT